MRFRNLQKQLSEKQASSGDLKFPIWHNDKMILLNAESEISLIKSEQQRILVFSDHLFSVREEPSTWLAVE